MIVSQPVEENTEDTPRPTRNWKLVLTWEEAAYALLFALALFLRFSGLGLAPLADSEAGWALQALGVVQGSPGQLGAQPGYLSLTGWLFWLAGDSNGAARFLPALAGSLLVLVPFWLRGADRANTSLRWAGLLFAWFVAADAGMIAISRQAGGEMLAMAFSLSALALWIARRRMAAAIFAALALLGGPGLLTGLLGMGVAWGLGRLLQAAGWLTALQAGLDQNPPSGGDTTPEGLPSSAPWLAGGLVFVLAATLFFQLPQGLAAFTAVLPAYLQSWLATPTFTPLQIVALLPLTQPVALVFGLIGAVNAWREPAAAAGRWLSLWALAAWLVALVYPARQPADTLWAAAPLYALAAWFLAQRLIGAQWKTYFSRWALGLAALWVLLTLVIGQFIGQIYLMQKQLAYGQIAPETFDANLRAYLLIIVGVVFIGLIASGLAAVSFSNRTAFNGTLLALTVVLSAVQVSALWWEAYRQQPGSYGLWAPHPAPGQMGLLKETLDDLSRWTNGLPGELDVVVTVDSPALAWALRDYRNLRFASRVLAQENPSVIVTSDQVIPQISADYRGQDFLWRSYPGWQGVTPNNGLAWWMDRQAPLVVERVILWARSDLFPGGELTEIEPAVIPPATLPGEELSPEEEIPEQE